MLTGPPPKFNGTRDILTIPGADTIRNMTTASASASLPSFGVALALEATKVAEMIEKLPAICYSEDGAIVSLLQRAGHGSSSGPSRSRWSSRKTRCDRGRISTPVTPPHHRRCDKIAALAVRNDRPSRCPSRSVRRLSAKLLRQLVQLAQLEACRQHFFAPLPQLTQLKPQDEIHG
jgi:hypothetical protein